MGKYAEQESAALSAFASAEWKAEGVVTMPTNFVGDVKSNEYIRVHIISGHPDPGYANLDMMAGQMVIDIFTPSGVGPSRSTRIADLLDKYLVGKTFKSSAGAGSVQFGASIVSGGGTDRGNSALYRSSYTVPLSYFTNGN